MIENISLLYGEQFHRLSLGRIASQQFDAVPITVTRYSEVAPAEEDLGPLKPLSEDKQGFKDLARRTAKKYGLNPDYFEAQIWAESSFKNTVRSGKGAMGLGQLMPGTARELGVKNPWDPAENLDGAARYMVKMLKMFDNNIDLALAAYNAGPGRVKRAGGIPNIRETQDYVKKINAYVRRLRN